MLPTVPLNDLSRQIAVEMPHLLEAVQSVIKSGTYILGSEVSRFENDLAELVGTAFARSCASGTDALEIALRALGVGAGDSVATVANAGGYTSTALQKIGATPVFIDCDFQGRMNPTDLKEKLGSSTAIKAVVVTHLYGLNSNVEECVEIGRHFGASVVEDCAQSIGAEVSGKRLGSFGDASTFSFYPTKNLGAIGDAGAIATSDPEVASKVEMLRQYGWSSRYRVVEPFGSNSRMDEIQAAVLNYRISQVDERNSDRRSIWARYQAALNGSQWTMIGSDSKEFVAHLGVLLTPSGHRQKTELFFAQNGIATGIHYPVLDYKQSAWVAKFDTRLAVAEDLVERILTIPLFPDMTDSEVARVENVLKRLEQVPA